MMSFMVQSQQRGGRASAAHVVAAFTSSSSSSLLSSFRSAQHIQIQNPKKNSLFQRQWQNHGQHQRQRLYLSTRSSNNDSFDAVDVSVGVDVGPRPQQAKSDASYISKSRMPFA